MDAVWRERDTDLKKREGQYDYKEMRMRWRETSDEQEISKQDYRNGQTQSKAKMINSGK